MVKEINELDAYKRKPRLKINFVKDIYMVLMKLYIGRKILICR